MPLFTYCSQIFSFEALSATVTLKGLSVVGGKYRNLMALSLRFLTVN